MESIPKEDGMPQDRDRSMVVVGTDGSVSSFNAVRFAAEEAARRGGRLRIVTATPWPDLRERSSLAVEPVERQALTDAEAALAAAAEFARAVLPDEAVTSATVVGWPAAALIEESRDAAVLVLGNRGHGGLAGLVLGSIAIGLAAEAHCPVAIVRDPGASAPTPGAEAPVVVGVERGERADAALAAAFEAAELHRAPLVAVHAWSPPLVVGPIELAPILLDQARLPENEAAALAGAVRPYRDRHPQVEVVELVREGRPDDVLVAASVGARLLVVATRGRRELGGLVLGSVTHVAIRRAPCPVLIVRGRERDDR